MKPTADLNTINLEITGTSESAEAAVRSSIQALEGLRNVANSLSGIKIAEDTVKSLNAVASAMNSIANAAQRIQDSGVGAGQAFAGFAGAINEVASACKSITQEDVARLEAITNLMNAASAGSWEGAGTRIGEALRASAQNTGASSRTASRGNSAASGGFSSLGGLKSVYGSVKSTVSGITKAVSKLSSTFSLAQTPIGKFVSSLMRVAKMRLLRSIISSITRGASAGLKNLANASAEANATLSQLSSASLTFQNSLGGALYSALAGVVGMLKSIINAAASAMNWINMLFSALSGKGTFMKATSTTKKYAESLGGAAGGAKALKQELMGFDEINALSPDGGGGGGGGGAGSLDYGSMFEETAIDGDLLHAIETADATILGEKLAEKVNDALAGIKWEEKLTKAENAGNFIATFINGAVNTLDSETIGSAIAGVVNTGLTAVNKFINTTDWPALGKKIREFIENAIKDIKPSDVGEFVAAKIKIALGMLSGLMPQSYAEWKGITDWVANAIGGAIRQIKSEQIRDVVLGVLRGGLALITSLGESHVFSKLAGAVLDGITDAISEITPQQLKNAIESALSEIWAVAGKLLEFVINIENIKVKMDNPVINAISTYALFRLLQKALPAFGLKAFNTGQTLALSGAVMATIDVIAKTGQLIKSAQNGENISWEDIADVIASALQGAGLFVMSKNFLAGAIVFTIGLVLDLVVSLNNGSLDSETGNAMKQVSEAFKKQSPTKAVLNVKPMLEGVLGVGELSDAVYQRIIDFYTVNDKYNKVLEKGTQAIAEGLSTAGQQAYIEWGAALNAIEDWESHYSTLLGFIDQGNSTGYVGLERFFEDVGLLGESASVAEPTVAALADSMTEAADAAKEVAGADLGVLESVDVNGVNGAKESVAELGTTMQATGKQAEELYTKIVEIPSDIVYNLEFNNYDQIMRDLDSLKQAMADTGTFGAFGFKVPLASLASWVVDTVVTPISDAFNTLDLAAAGRKMMRSLKKGMRAISLPKFKLQWQNNTTNANILGETHQISIPTPKITFYAKGGFVSAGEVFVANEAGPELVGKIGNRSAVANETQIGDAIFKYMDAYGGNQGVDANALANALVSAMKAAGLGAVYLDGKMLGNSINREAKRSGKPVINY